jgi:hypothetical protein
MTQKPGATPTLSTILKHSATTSTRQLLQVIVQQNRKIAQLEIEIMQLKAMKLMYRPPGANEHMNVVEYLDTIEERLRCLEK